MDINNLIKNIKMKKVIILVAILSMSSCTFIQKAESYVNKHCPKSYIKDPSTGKLNIYYECDSLYSVDKLNSKCSKIEVCFDATQAKISGSAVCDSLLNIEDLIKQVLKKK